MEIAMDADLGGNQESTTQELHLRADQEQMRQDLRRLGLDDDLGILIMRQNVGDLIGYVSSMVVLPMEILEQAIVADHGLSPEALSLGVAQVVDRLRPHGA